LTEQHFFKKKNEFKAFYIKNYYDLLSKKVLLKNATNTQREVIDKNKSCKNTEKKIKMYVCN
jgi:hypothetical protein